MSSTPRSGRPRDSLRHGQRPPPASPPSPVQHQGQPANGSPVWLDGRIVDGAVPHLSVADRGFQLGDGVFETLRARRGVPIELAEHLVRLHESAAAMAIPLSLDDSGFAAAIAELLRAAGLDGDGSSGPPGDAALRITLSRGVAGRGLAPSALTTSTLAIQAWPYAPPDADILERGLASISSAIRHDAASPLGRIKTTSRADFVYARLEADRAGASEAIFLTVDGRLAEASTANLWIARGSDLATPPLVAGVLAGTTRSWLLDMPPADLLTRALAASGCTTVEERDLWPADLLAADEAFVSSSVAGIVPLTRHDGRPVGTGRPGPLTARLRAAREAWIDKRSIDGSAAVADSGTTHPTNGEGRQ